MFDMISMNFRNYTNEHLECDTVCGSFEIKNKTNMKKQTKADS